jgi:hypothetical protein
VRWFRLEDGKYREIAADADGIFQSRVLPGLWLRPKALLELNLTEMSKTLRRGLAGPEHAAFLEQLAKHRSSSAQDSP